MKTLNRDGIQRMIESGSGSVGGGVSASTESLAGYATQMWVNGNYISIKFFSKLFQALDENGDPIDPNDMDTVIDSIQSMFGFWTNAYISALGQNDEGGEVALTLASLADVDVSTVSNGDSLVWNAALRKWVPGSSGIDLTAMWAALATNGNQQIDSSHLSTALSGYATQTWVGQQGYITASALNGYATESWVGTQISDMATQTWVGNNYLSQTDAATTYLSKTDAANTYLSIAFFARLFRAYNGSTAVNPNDTTSTIDNIKAMFGFWTEQYISALGNSGGGSAYVTMDQVWTALGNATNEQINISHLSTALSGYATTASLSSYVTTTALNTALASYNPTNNFKTINGYSIIGTGDINVGGGGGSYLPLSGGTLTGGLTIKTIRYPLRLQTTGDESSFILAPNNKTSTYGDYVIGCYDNTNSGMPAFFIYDATLGKQTFHLENGRCSINDGSSYPSYNLQVNGSIYTNDSISVFGSNREMLILNQTVGASASGQGAYVRFQNNGVNLGGVGYNTSLGTFLEDVRNGNYYSLILNGTSITYNGWDLITSNSIGSQSVAYASTAGTATDPTKVLKAGDTMTGKLIISTSSYPLELRTSGSESSIQFCPSGTSGNGRYVVGCYDGTTSGYPAFFIWDNTLFKQVFHFEGGSCSINNGNNTPSYVLHVNGTFYASGNSSIGGTFAVSGATTMSGKLTMNQSNIELVNTSTNNGICVELKGVSEDIGLCIGDGNTNRGIIDFKRSKWMIYFDASNTYCEYGNFICSGGVTALSDARHKSIVGGTEISVEQIARMRSVKFLWNDGRTDHGVHVGSIAQDWQNVLPEVVLRKDDAEGTLSLNYGVAALISVITTARKVVDHECRIRELEKEVEQLKKA